MIACLTMGLASRWFLRWNIPLFDYDVQGQYVCGMYPSLPNNTWHEIQSSPLGHRGAHFATFSDPWLRARNLYFDFRFFREPKNVTDRPFLFADGPRGDEQAVVSAAAKKQLLDPSFEIATECPSDFNNAHKSDNSSDDRRGGSALCLFNCLPCDGEISMGSESCTRTVVQRMDHGDISNDVAAGVFSDWISETSSFEPLNLDDTLPDDIGCDQLLANKGGACISTNKQTDPDTCKAHGYTMIVPKSRAHWKHLWAKYGRSYFDTIPGIYKPTDGGDYTQVAMNSQAMTPGGYRAIDGGAWWLRDTLYSEPNGNYKANCWLGYRESNVDDLKFDDANCRFSTTKYICATPKPSTPTKKNKTVITTFDDLVCPQFVTAGSARFEVLVERGVAVTVTRADNSNVSWWSEDLELSCRGTVGRKTGKREMACLSTYFHQPAMMTVAGAFDILAANQRSKSDGDATGSLRGTTIAAGGDFSSERTEQRSQTHKAKCRCVTGDSTKGISICVTGCGDPVFVCWMGMGCASDEKSCNGGKCTCKPSDQHENTMTFDECKRQCGRVGMSIPGDDIGVSAARGTGCGTDSEEMWIDDRMETDSVLTLNAAALALARPAQTAMSMDAATAESRRRLKGCGWLNLTHIDAFGDVLTSASGPLFMYTDSKGWVISNRVFDVALDPGPGVVFASSYRSQQLDYCDGVALRTGDLATTTVSYLVEPLEL
jgi:hypothetical protein